MSGRPSDARAARPAAPAPPAPEQVFEAIAQLSLRTSLAGHEEALVETFMEWFVRLLPGRHVCIRLIDPGPAGPTAGDLTLLRAEGPLRPDARVEPLRLARATLARQQVSEAALRAGRVVLDGYRPLFSGGESGVAVPLAAGGELLGAVNLEYPAGTADAAACAAEDERALLPLCSLLSVALRNSRLLDETTFLRDYLAKLVDHANALILVCDRERRVTVFNRALERLTGHGRDEVLGQDVCEWLPGSERAGFHRVFVQTLVGKASSDFEVLLPARDGQARRAVFNTAPLSGVETDVEGIIAVGQDLTAIRTLESRVAQAEKLATVGRLAAGVAHELNNPLTAISAGAEYLIRKSERLKGFPAGDVEKLRRIAEGAERILRLSRELTQYARPSSEEARVLDVNAVVRRAIEFCDHVLRAAGARVVRELDDHLPAVFAVRSHVEQIVVNLVTNAAHALPARGGRVRVRTRADPAYVTVTIADNGSGIDERHVARIFEPFFTTKPDGRGTGLGLSIVRNLVELNRGTIAVKSRAGRGSAFTFTLPRAAAADPEETG